MFKIYKFIRFFKSEFNKSKKKIIDFSNIINDKWGNKTLKRGDEYGYIKCTIDAFNVENRFIYWSINQAILDKINCSILKY